MAITRQLFKLQELDTEIEQKEQTMQRKQAQLGNRDTLNVAQNRLAAEQRQLKDYQHQYREAEAEVNDLLAKIAEIEGQLYSGKITNPKELSSLQHESSTMKARDDEMEEKTLVIIDRVEEAERTVATASDELKKLEEDWQRQQQQLSQDIEQLNSNLEDLRQKRQEQAAQIDKATLSLYEKIQKQKNTAVARVEQGICHACRISLSASALQRARSGQPIQCGTCGRILYVP